jgi:hypothetical protein
MGSGEADRGWLVLTNRYESWGWAIGGGVRRVSHLTVSRNLLEGGARKEGNRLCIKPTLLPRNS